MKGLTPGNSCSSTSTGVFDPRHEAAVRLEARTTLRLQEPLHVLRVPVCGRDRSCPRDGVGVPIELLQYGARRGHECPQAAFRLADRTS
jgi:hypothetical protein